MNPSGVFVGERATQVSLGLAYRCLFFAEAEIFDCGEISIKLVLRSAPS